LALELVTLQVLRDQAKEALDLFAYSYDYRSFDDHWTRHRYAMDSPRSEEGLTRFSTPVSDLDDHRHQPSTRLRRGTVNTQAARNPAEGQGASFEGHDAQQPDLVQVSGVAREAAPVSRDFEQRTVEENKPTEEHLVDQGESLSPVIPRRATTRMSQHPPNRSRESSRSSRTSSPANSVDAFADPRRREKANTIGSKAPSDLDLGLQRTVSGGTHRRRPTFNEGSIRSPKVQDDRPSSHVPAADDVCFPAPEETTKTYKIDFEELDEFVALTSKCRSSEDHVCRQKLSFSSHGNRPRTFDELRAHIIPQINTTQNASTLKPDIEYAIDDKSEVIDAEDGDPLDAKGSKEHRPSLAEPSRYSFFSSELEQTIHAPDFGDLLTPGETFRDLFELPEESGAWWLDILNPTEAELQVFQRAFGIHRLTTEDIITQEAREKVELFKQYYFVCFRSFFQMDEKSEDYMEPVNVYMVVFREGIITITYTQSPHAANVRKRIGKLRDYMALTADWICYAMMYGLSTPKFLYPPLIFPFQ